MTRDETKDVLLIMMTAWPNYKPQLTSDLVNVWYELIGDLDNQQALAALKAYAQTDTSGFAPSVGQLRGKLVEMMQFRNMTEAEAWEKIVCAIRRSGYYAVEEFNRLPPELQAAVGGPETLRALALGDESGLGYAKAGIMQNFRTMQKREKERLQLSGDIQMLIARVKDLLPDNAAGEQNK